MFTKNRSRSADFFRKKTQECARACAREKRKKKAPFGLKEGTFWPKRRHLFPQKNASFPNKERSKNDFGGSKMKLEASYLQSEAINFSWVVSLTNSLRSFFSFDFRYFQ